jgi:hypothetical protein
MASSLLYVGVAPDELLERVGGGVWQRWTEREPVLRAFESPLDPAWQNAPERDQAMGALIRLAAKDGGDDQLAAVSVCHRMRWATAKAIRDFGIDDDAIVVGALWESVRTFPWRRRSRAYASSLCFDTRLRVLRFQTTRRHPHDRFRYVYVDSDEVLDWAGTTITGVSTDTAGSEEPTAELFDLFDWAHGHGVLGEDDFALLRDLLTAAYAVADDDTPWMARGASSQAALRWLAARTGTSARTLRRRRDCAIRQLRSAVPEYLRDVA